MVEAGYLGQLESRAGHEDPSFGQMQRREQIDAVAVAGVVFDGGGGERSRVANDHGSAAEAVAEQLVNSH